MVRLGAIPENIVERVTLALGLAPTPLADTMLGPLLARTIMAATQLGVFEALAGGALTASEVAARCGTDPRATEALLVALVGGRYVRARGARYSLAPVTRRWLLARSRFSLRDATLHRYLDLALMDHSEDYVRTGRPAEFHDTMSREEWGVYQRGQRSHALLAGWEAALRSPVRRGARAMLDIGGAHGYYSVAFCRRYAGLCATVLDLPAAVEASAPMLARERVNGRVRHRAGNVLVDDLGTAEYDVVLMANVAHHFDDATNRALQRRIARALRPGGCSVVLDLLRPPSGKVNQVGALASFYFAVTSASGTWSSVEIAGWQREARLLPRKPIMLFTSPGLGLQAALKPSV